MNRERIAEIIEKFVIDEGAGYFGKYEAAEAIIAALPDMIAPLVWVGLEGGGAKATAWNKANYRITQWSNGQFFLAESYPGNWGCFIPISRYPTLDAAKEAANAHHRAAIVAAFKEPTT